MGVANNEGGEGTNKRTRIYNIYTGERGWHLRVLVGWVGRILSYRPSQIVKANKQTNEKNGEKQDKTKTKQNKTKQNKTYKKNPFFFKTTQREKGVGGYNP